MCFCDGGGGGFVLVLLYFCIMKEVVALNRQWRMNDEDEL